MKSISVSLNIDIDTPKRIKIGKHKEGLYHIQHINVFHSNFNK